jgi:hydrogenase maturation protease
VLSARLLLDPAEGDGVSEEPRIVVMGIGNPLVGDEGVGPRVAEQLMSGYTFPDRVEVMDAGTIGLGMIDVFRRSDVCVVVDAVDGTGEPPGAIVKMAPDEMAPNQVLHSLHDMKLADVLQAADFAGFLPEVRFIGVQIGSMETLVTELTPEVEAAIPLVEAEVLRVLAGLGVEAEPSCDASTDADAVRCVREPTDPDGARRS